MAGQGAYGAWLGLPCCGASTCVFPGLPRKLCRFGATTFDHLLNGRAEFHLGKRTVLAGRPTRYRIAHTEPTVAKPLLSCARPCLVPIPLYTTPHTPHAPSAIPTDLLDPRLREGGGSEAGTKNFASPCTGMGSQREKPLRNIREFRCAGLLNGTKKL